jgi:hypothetical protein
MTAQRESITVKLLNHITQSIGTGQMKDVSCAFDKAFAG